MKNMGFSLLDDSAMQDPKRGDVAVFGKVGNHNSGHIQMYDGKQWVSDFKQNTDFPWRDVNKSDAPLWYYRDMSSQK